MQKFIVSMLGSKGGTGKTTLAHVLATGLSARSIPTSVCLTDPDSLTFSSEGRPYHVNQISDAETLKSMISWFRDNDHQYSILIVDGMARNAEFDEFMAGASDLVYLPFIVNRGSDDALFRLSLDMDAIPKSFGLPNSWPTNTFEENYLVTVLEGKGLLGDASRYAGRIVEPVKRIASLTEVTSVNFSWDFMNTQARNQCRALADKTLDLLSWR